VPAQRKSTFRRFTNQLGVVCLVAVAAGIAAGFLVHPAIGVVVVLLAWTLQLAVSEWARCLACGRSLVQKPGRFVRMPRVTVPEHCPHCGAAVP
jgi:hypothetical protein